MKGHNITNAFEDSFHGTCNDNNKPLHHMFQLGLSWALASVVGVFNTKSRVVRRFKIRPFDNTMEARSLRSRKEIIA